MKTATIAALALACGMAHAEIEMVAKSGRDSIWLQMRQCDDAKTLALIPEEHRETFRSVSANISGKYFAGCWALTMQNVAFIQFEDGEVAQVPIRAFKAEEGA